MKKILCALLILGMTLGCCAYAVPEVLLNSNPLPGIFEKVSPSVAVLMVVSNVWDAKTDAVTKEDISSDSAVLVKEGGYFLTNYHVVDDADELEIRFGDGRTYAAYVVGGDEACDVAVVKVDDELDIQPVAIGSSSKLRVGDLVCTIGSPVVPEALYNTLTSVQAELVGLKMPSEYRYKYLVTKLAMAYHIIEVESADFR